jgi:hypothetical protein
MGCVVAMQSYNGAGVHYGTASGIVFHHGGEHTYILTARHTLYYREPVVPEEGDFPFPVIILGLTREVLLTPRVLLGSGLDSVVGEMIWESAFLDAALVRVARIDRPAVEYWLKPPAWDAPSLTVGLYEPMMLMMHLRGHYQGMAGQYLVFSSHAHAGCSGGGIFVYTEGEWALSGLTVAIGSNSPTDKLHHVTFAIPVYNIIEALGDTLPASEEAPEPLPLDILQGL